MLTNHVCVLIVLLVITTLVTSQSITASTSLFTVYESQANFTMCGDQDLAFENGDQLVFSITSTEFEVNSLTQTVTVSSWNLPSEEKNVVSMSTPVLMYDNKVIIKSIQLPDYTKLTHNALNVTFEIDFKLNSEIVGEVGEFSFDYTRQGSSSAYHASQSIITIPAFAKRVDINLDYSVLSSSVLNLPFTLSTTPLLNDVVDIKLQLTKPLSFIGNVTECEVNGVVVSASASDSMLTVNTDLSMDTEVLLHCEGLSITATTEADFNSPHDFHIHSHHAVTESLVIYRGEVTREQPEEEEESDGKLKEGQIMLIIALIIVSLVSIYLTIMGIHLVLKKLGVCGFKEEPEVTLTHVNKSGNSARTALPPYNTLQEVV